MVEIAKILGLCCIVFAVGIQFNTKDDQELFTICHININCIDIVKCVDEQKV